jgi:hypothetical protein
VIDGHYSGSEYNASFVGFLPSRNPVFTIVVIIDSPHGRNAYYGGTVAGPVFKRIAEAALRQYGVPSFLNPPQPVLLARREVGLETGAREQPASVIVDAAPVSALGPSPAANPVLPDLRGLGARDALKTLAQLGVNARLQGIGLVIDQKPAPGTPIDHGVVSTLWLGRQSTVITTVAGAGQ